MEHSSKQFFLSQQLDILETPNEFMPLGVTLSYLGQESVHTFPSFQSFRGTIFSVPVEPNEIQLYLPTVATAQLYSSSFFFPVSFSLLSQLHPSLFLGFALQKIQN